MLRNSASAFLLLASLAAMPKGASAQLSESAAWAAHVRTEYRLFTNIVYHRSNNFEAKLNVYRPRAASGPNPTVIYFHGGGWVFGSPEHAVLEILPYLEMGWTVVTVGYRLTHVANAPAAVEDSRCALRWVIQNSQQYFVDTTRIVLSGESAGGHLALATGILPPEAGFGRECLADVPLKVAAIINWFGLTDLRDLADGPNRRSAVVMWLGSQPNREEMARRLSPLTYIRSGLPPILTIHGTADDVVPYSHATRLHQELDKYGVPNQLLTIPDGGHGPNFTRQQNVRSHAAIRAFLARHNMGPTRFAAPPPR